MLKVKTCRDSHGMGFLRSAALVGLWLVFPAVSALSALAQDSKPLSPTTLAKSEKLPPLPATATFNRWLIPDNALATPTRCMVWGSRVRMEWSGLQVSIAGPEKLLNLHAGEKKGYVTQGAQENELAEYVGRLRRLVTDPHYLSGTMREPLGESKIGGRRVVGYRLVDNRKIQTIWADPDSLLPVQIEELFPELSVIYADFAFNVALDKSLLSLDPPAGYAVVARTARRPATEVDLIELFRQFRDHGRHAFPDTVDVRAVRQSPGFGASSKLTNGQRREITDKIIQGAMFVVDLPPVSDAHYAGKGMKATATDAPLFWYRPKAKQSYRLIRADLSVVEVDAPPRVATAEAIDEWRAKSPLTRRPLPDPGAHYHARVFKEATQAGGQLKYIGPVPVLLLQGTPEEMGRQQGLLLAEAKPLLRQLVKDYARAPRLGVSWPAVILLCKAGLQRAPEAYRRELEAGIRAAALTADERDALIAVNVLAEMPRLGSCSSLVVEPARSRTGEMLFGRNLDSATHEPPQGRDRFGLVTVYRPRGKHAFAAVGYPGLGGVFSGMNDAGLALATNSVGVSRENEPAFNPLGTPLLCTFRRVLEECGSLKEAEALLRKNAGYTRSVLVMACDPGRAVVFEITTRRIVTRPPENHLLACTNHYRLAELCRSLDCPRYEALSRLRQEGSLFACPDVERAMRLVGGGNTIQSMVFEPKSLRLHVALGCLPLWEGPFAVIDLAALFTQKTE